MVHSVTQHTEFIRTFITFQIPYGYMVLLYTYFNIHPQEKNGLVYSGFRYPQIIITVNADPVYLILPK
jgi:hypothetical protein